MLGVTNNPQFTQQDHLVKEVAAEMGRGHTFGPAPVGVFFDEENAPSKDPYFFGEGPDRVGCVLCGECMTGCKKNAKNSLDKNYLYFAQKFGAQVIAENKVVDIIPQSEDGDKGYVVKTKKVTGVMGGRRGNTYKTRGIVFSAGAMGTNTLLLKLKHSKRLPRLSEHLGKYARTNSEAIVTVKSKSKDVDFSQGVAITSSVHPNDVTHIEPVRYGYGHDYMGTIMGLMTSGGGVRQVKAFCNALMHPIRFMRVLNPIGWAYRSIILLVMQTEDNYINFKRKRRLLWPFTRSLTSVYGTDKKNPTWIPIGYEFGLKLAKKIDGVAMNVTTENLMNAPLTAHIMGGCTIGPTPEEGVIDEESRIKNYKNLLVCDGSQIPENLGVNPALSITAFSERAMAFIPPKYGEMRHLIAEEKWGVKKHLVKKSKHAMTM
jgi:cholesterol oxidase